MHPPPRLVARQLGLPGAVGQLERSWHHCPQPGSLQLVGRGLSPDLKCQGPTETGIPSPSQGAGKGSWESEVLGRGSGRSRCQRGGIWEFELAEKEVRCGWGGEGPSLDLDEILLCAGAPRHAS